MHELSIADAIVELAVRHAHGRRVTRVEVSVGALRQVVPSALELAFTLCARETEVEGAELALTAVAAAGRCRACGAESEQEAFPLVCADCESWDLEIVGGDELRVDALEVETESDDAALVAAGRAGP
jgi:hydrogenase nickel incorporation protein HypA/HybF